MVATTWSLAFAPFFLSHLDLAMNEHLDYFSKTNLLNTEFIAGLKETRGQLIHNHTIVEMKSSLAIRIVLMV